MLLIRETGVQHSIEDCVSLFHRLYHVPKESQRQYLSRLRLAKVNPHSFLPTAFQPSQSLSVIYSCAVTLRTTLKLQCTCTSQLVHCVLSLTSPSRSSSRHCLADNHPFIRAANCKNIAHRTLAHPWSIPS